MDTTQVNARKASLRYGSLMPVRAVAAREWREHLSSTRFRLLLATTLVLVTLSALAGVFNYRSQMEQYRRAIERGEEKLHEATTWSELQPIMVRPVAPLMILNSGSETRDGRIAIASNEQIPATTEDSASGTPYLARFSQFDVTTVVVYLLGLLAVLLSSDSVSGEKERGTLALSFSNPLARWQLLLGKYLGGMAALALSLALSITAALVVWLLSRVPFPASAWPRVGLWLVSLLIYMSAMFLVGLLVSVLTRRASTSLLVAMLSWFSLVIFIPAAAAFSARQLSPSPSSYTLNNEMLRLTHELEEKSLEVRQALGPLPESEGFSISLEQGVSMNFYSQEAYRWWLKYYAERTRLEREYARKVYQATKQFQAQNRAQAETAFRLSVLSPASHLERVADELTGTSRDDTYYFLEAAQRYHQTLMDFYDTNHLTTSLRWISDDPPDTDSSFPKRELPARTDDNEERESQLESDREMYARVMAERKSGQRALPVNEVPRFDYQSQPVSLGLARVSSSIVALLLINLFAAVVVFLRFRRYDVRFQEAGD